MSEVTPEKRCGKRKLNDCKYLGCTRTWGSGLGGGLGYCNMHYKRHREGRDMNVPANYNTSRKTVCTYPGCSRIGRITLGYCSLHYHRYHAGRNMDAPVRKPYSIHDKCSIGQAHKRARTLWGAVSQYPCISCGFDAYDWAYDGTDPTQLYGLPSSAPPGRYATRMFYSRYPEFYMPLCRRCHGNRDGRIAARELRQYRLLQHRFGLSYTEIYELCERHVKRAKRIAKRQNK
jgi:hypothetical protein